MESAIPSHLRCPRTRDARASEDYVPPNPAYVARMGDDVKQVVMAYVGVQYRTATGRSAARAGIRRLRATAPGADAPGHHDTSFFVDAEGYETIVWTAYWCDTAAFARWLAEPSGAAWWHSGERLTEGCGWFREIACPGAERFETLFSTPGGAEGVGRLAPYLSGEIREHAYWGGMRDRLPIAQTDALRGGTSPGVAPQSGLRVRIGGAENRALIRSGQDWSRTQGEERRVYLEQVEPTLQEGMDFLRDEGLKVGCLANRYVTLLDEDFNPIEKSFGVSWWQSLEHMERWAESHPTHLAIFGTFMRMVQTMNFSVALGLYHEVAVLKAEDQQFEYINCHPGTGLLRMA